MRRLMLAASLLVLAVPLCAQQVQSEPDHWMTHYYEHPAPEGFVGWIRAVEAEGRLYDPRDQVPLMVFMSELVRQHPEYLGRWCAQLASLGEVARIDFGWAVFNAGAGAADHCLGRQLHLDGAVVASIRGADRYSPTDQQVGAPVEIDALWAVFDATGSALAVNRVIDVLARPVPEQGTSGATDLAMLRGVARWSLESNVRGHARVAEIIRQRMLAESDSLAEELAQILRQSPESSEVSR